MARACISNPNGYGTLLIEYIKMRSPILGIEFLGDRICFEFNGVVTISFDDYLEIHPLKSKITEYKERIRMEKECFNKWFQSNIVRSLRGGEIIEYVPGERIVIKSTEKTEIICIRVTSEEKKRLEEESKKQGLSLSEYIRTKISLF